MVIACEKCSTRFHLDDGRIPETGVRVRCSRCKHAFFVAPPGSAAQLLHAAAAEAAAAEAVPPPPPSADLGSPPGGEGDEEDWEFNIEPSPAAKAAAASAPASPASGSLPAADFAAGFPEGELGRDASLAGAGGSLDAGGSFDLGVPSGDDVVDEPGFGEPEDFFATEGGLLDDGGQGADPAPAPPRPAAPPPADEASEFDELGSPDTWDFLADDARGSAPAPAAAQPTAAPSRGATARAASVEAVRPVRDEPVPDVFPRPVQAGAWALLGLALVLGLVGAMRDPVARAAPPQPVVAGALSLGALELRVVENLHVGPIWVVRGELRNAAAEPRPLEVGPRVRILDAAGREVGALSLGPLADPDQLRLAPPGEVAQELVRAASRLRERGLAPGDALELHAVLAPLPAGAARVEAALGP